MGGDDERKGWVEKLRRRGFERLRISFASHFKLLEVSTRWRLSIVLFALFQIAIPLCMLFLV
jgi:hypothetical protein